MTKNKNGVYYYLCVDSNTSINMYAHTEDRIISDQWLILFQVALSKQLLSLLVTQSDDIIHWKGIMLQIIILLGVANTAVT